MKYWNTELEKLINIKNKDIYDHMGYFINKSYELYSSVYNYYNIEKEINSENILNLIIDLHNVLLNKEPKSLKDIDTILDSEILFKLATKNKIISEDYNFLLRRIKIYEYETSLSSRMIIEIFTSEKFKTQSEICFEVLNSKNIDVITTIGTMLGSSICYVKSLIRYIFLINKYSILISPNNELLIKYKEYINNEELPENEAILETYNIYKDSYHNKFDEILKFNDFWIIMHSRYLELDS